MATRGLRAFRVRRVKHGPFQFGICVSAVRGPLRSMGVEQFRVGGTSGGGKLRLGEGFELGERRLPLELLTWGVCRRVEARVPLK